MLGKSVIALLGACLLWASPANAVVYTVDLSDPDFSVTGTIELAPGTSGSLSSVAFGAALVSANLTFIGGTPQGSDTYNETHFDTLSTSRDLVWDVSLTEVRLSISDAGRSTLFFNNFEFNLDGGDGLGAFFEIEDDAVGEPTLAFVSGDVFASATVIPLPAGAVLLVSGLAVFGAMRRRRPI